jgi:hypothetical protein
MKKNDIRNSCGGKGCSVRGIVLPNDSKPKPICMEVHGVRNDIAKVSSVSNLSLGKELEKKR